MSKTQVNYRIDADLLDRIKDTAKAEGYDSYTQWIITACLEKLGEVQPSSDSLDERIAEEIEKRLGESNASAVDVEAMVEEKLQGYQANFNQALERVYERLEESEKEMERLLAMQKRADIPRRETPQDEATPEKESFPADTVTDSSEVAHRDEGNEGNLEHKTREEWKKLKVGELRKKLTQRGISSRIGDSESRLRRKHECIELLMQWQRDRAQKT